MSPPIPQESTAGVPPRRGLWRWLTLVATALNLGAIAFWLYVAPCRPARAIPTIDGNGYTRASSGPCAPGWDDISLHETVHFEASIPDEGASAEAILRGAIADPAVRELVIRSQRADQLRHIHRPGSTLGFDFSLTGAGVTDKWHYAIRLVRLEAI